MVVVCVYCHKNETNLKTRERECGASILRNQILFDGANRFSMHKYFLLVTMRLISFTVYLLQMKELNETKNCEKFD